MGVPRLMVRREMSAPEAGPGLTRLAPRPAPRAPMSAMLRLALLSTCALLWLSGCAWLLLHFAFPQAGEFGPLPNPWEPLLMRVHGAIAVAGVFLLGCVAAGHLAERWGGAHNRGSGVALAVSAVLLVISGYALYYSTGTVHDIAARAHEVLGVASLVAALAHWWRSAAARAARTLPPPR
jgi:hypothetical protein